MISRRSILAAPAIVACASLMSLRGVKMPLEIGWTGKIIVHPRCQRMLDEFATHHYPFPNVGDLLAFDKKIPPGWEHAGVAFDHDNGDSFLIGRKL